MLARLVGAAEPWSLLPLRIVVGVVFLVHGGQKLFVFGLAGFAGYLGKLGLEPAPFWSVVVTAVEFLGGIAVLVGFLTRWAALFLAVDMLVAIFTVHLPKGFFVDKGDMSFRSPCWAPA
jgi:putative oxidoreductase